ncbi:MAG TPA: hypothetical protein VEH10_03690 [Thermoplasmata archaeon]|nr:hypothetical protein [Thermoplasmata archaeon]
MASSAQKSYPSTAFILSLIGGIFILLGGLADAAIYAIIGGAVLSIFPGLGALLIALAVIALLFGLIIIFGAIQLRSKPESAKTWGIIILVLAILSWIGGGGFFIGFILALIGGILALVWKPPMPAQAAWGQQPMAPPAAPGWGGQPPASPPPS